MLGKRTGSSVHEALDVDKNDFNETHLSSNYMEQALYRIHGDGAKNLEKRYASTNPSLLHQIQSDVSTLYKEGYVILPNLLTASEVSEIHSVTSNLLDTAPKGRNGFEGRQTQRVYALLAKSRVYDKLLLHPRVEGIIDSTLRPNNLLTAFQVINILPQEEPQTLHYDDSFVLMPRPRRHTSIAFIWAISDFTASNGATVVIPRSHLWPDSRAASVKDVQHLGKTVEMPAGSCVCLLGTLWHCGGRNVSDQPRMALTNQHCEPFIRPQENFVLSTPLDLVEKLDPTIQRMIGYSIHYPFIGHSDGLHPTKAIPKLLDRYRTLSKL